jgi:hypothetical protein
MFIAYEIKYKEKLKGTGSQDKTSPYHSPEFSFFTLYLDFHFMRSLSLSWSWYSAFLVALEKEKKKELQELNIMQYSYFTGTKLPNRLC